MNSKRLNVHFFALLAIIIFGNSFFILRSSAFIYSNPSTSPLWSYSTGKQFISAVAISSDGSYISAACEYLISSIEQRAEGKLFLFDNLNSMTKKPIWNYSISNSFYSLAISSDGSYTIAGGGWRDEKLYLFNNSKLKPEWNYSIGGNIYDVAISDDDNYIAAAGGQHHKAFLFKTMESLPIKKYSTTGLTLRVAISSNGSFMAATDNAAKLYFFNTSKSSPDWVFTHEEDMSTALSISSDGNYIASGGKKVHFFNKHNSIPLWTYNTSDYVTSIKISHDGNYIVAGCDYSDKNVYLFNRNKSIPEWRFSTGEWVESVAMSDNGDHIVALGSNYWLYLFNKSSPNPIWRYRLDGYPTASYDYSLDISTDGKYIVAGGRHRFYLFDRDITKPPKLIIPGYDPFFMFLAIGIITLMSSITIFRHFKRIQKKIVKKVKIIK
jgi:WD40 repeat protein